MASLKPTTKAQISGHKFLRRRLELGLVTGDIRMLHEPLRHRNRALSMGVGLSVLIMAGAGIMAWLAPNPDPGQAPVLKSPQGQIFAQVDGVLHPVPNVVSAQLIAGKPAAPVAIATVRNLGVPAGIADAPGFFNPHPGDHVWSLCSARQEVEPEFSTQLGNAGPRGSTIVHANLESRALKGYALVRADNRHWVLSPEGVTFIPDSALGDAVVRALGIDGDTPYWEVAPEFVSAFHHLPDFRVPQELPTVWDTGQEKYLRSGEGLSPVTPLAVRILAMLGAATQRVSPAQVAAVKMAESPVVLPEEQATFANPSAGWLCAVDGKPRLARPVEGLVPLPGKSVATHFGGLAGGGVAVDTGHGHLVVAATGERHSVAGIKDLEALGFDGATQAPWPIVRLLPEGSELSRERALRAVAAQPPGDDRAKDENK